MRVRSFRIMRHAYFPVVSLCFLLVLCTACGKDSGLSGKGSMWDTYDFRHPVPYGASVPDSRATSYDQYQDYEEYYTPPKGYRAPPAAYPDYEQDYVPPRGYSQPQQGYTDYEEYYTPPQRNYNPCIPGDPGCFAAR